MGGRAREGERAFERGRRVWAKGRVEEAIAYYEEAIRLGVPRTRAYAHNNLAMIYVRNDRFRDPAKALAHAKKAATIAATEESIDREEERIVLDTLAQAYLLAGDEEAAARTRRRAGK